jgi:hypothetical protein
LAVPEKSNRWLEIEGSHGNEMVIAGASDRPLDAATLAALEHTPSFADNRVVTSPLLLPIVASNERGVGREVTSNKSPLDTRFEDLLHRDFETYRGIIVPHE